MHLTRHAIERMALRRISRLDVALVLTSASTRADHLHGATSHFGVGLDGRGIVVVTETDDHDRVITVMLEDR